MEYFKKKTFVPSSGTEFLDEQPQAKEKFIIKPEISLENPNEGAEVKQFYEDLLGTSSKTKRPLEITHTFRCEYCEVDFETQEFLNSHQLGVPHILKVNYKSSTIVDLTVESGPEPIKFAQEEPKKKLFEIPKENIGYKIMKTAMKWDETQGLGARSQGRVEPIPVRLKLNKKGLGEKGQGPILTSKTMASASAPLPNPTKSQGFLTKKQQLRREAQQRKKEAKIRAELYSDLPSDYI
jgi:hypothetical protein